MKHLLFILFLFWSTYTVAQTSCNCPTTKSHPITEEIKKSFSLNHYTIGLCGYQEVVNGDTVYYEARLFDCNSNEVMHEWWAIQPSTVEYYENRLIVNERFMAPIGDSFKYKWIPFFVTQLFESNGEINKRQYYLRDKYKYTRLKIEAIHNKYSITNKDTYKWNSSGYLKLCYQLFWCYVSGNSTSEQMLIEANMKFGGFNGHKAEEYHSLLRAIEQIKKYEK